MATWNKRRIIREIGEGDEAIRWCVENGFLPGERNCDTCQQPMSLRINDSGLGLFRCRRRHCRGESVARAKGTWFENSKLKPERIFDIMYSFASDYSYEHAREEFFDPLLGDQHLSQATLADWYNYCREIVALHILRKQYDAGPIGGPNTVVQIDESKFGRRKYNRGRHIEGHWVIWLIQNNSEDFRVFLCPDTRRGTNDLIPKIKQHVAPGTEIHTDSWKAYSGLEKCGMEYTHSVVNYFDPENADVSDEGFHTKRIESQWRSAKAWFATKRFPTDSFADHLCEWLWRTDCRRNNINRFQSLLDAIRDEYHV